MRTINLLVSTIVMCGSLLSTFCQTSGNTVKDRNEKWIEDLDFLAEKIPKIHKSLFHSMTKEQFEDFVCSLKRNIPNLTDNQIMTEFIRLGAMIGDGHSRIQPQTFHIFPIKTYIFKDGLYAIDAFDEYKDVIGMKLVKIGGKNLDEVYKAIEPLVQRDNEMQVKSLIPLFMQVPEALNGTGIIPDTDSTDFTFENTNGNLRTINVKSVSYGSYSQVMNSRPVKDDVPLYRRNPEKFYWFTYLKDTKTFYFQYNVVRDDPNDTSINFLKRLGDFVNSHYIDRFVVDIRNNGGGNLFTSIPFSKFIEENHKINQRGKLFVIIGRRTFSAASYFTSSLEYNTKAIFFGEPTGASPNHYGDPQRIVLPNSKIEAFLSTTYWENSFPFDKRQWTAPDSDIELTSRDYFENRDPVLEAVLNYKPEPMPQVKLTSAEIKNITGKYEYSPDQVLEIKNGREGLEFEITDFISSALYPVSKDEFKTDISNIELRFDRGSYDDAIIDVRGEQLKLKRVNSNYKGPVELLNSGRIKEAVEIYRKVKKLSPNRRTITEVSLNNLGYELLNKKKYDAAIAIFKLNVEFYPNAFNTYDSLGEAYMVTGQDKLAIKNYNKSIELNPNNENGKRMLEKINNK